MLSYSPIPTSQWWVQTSAWSHYFTTFSGISDQAQPIDFPDGQTIRIHKLVGPRNIGPLTLSCPFDPIAHGDIVDYWKAYSCDFLTIIATPVTCGEDPTPLQNTRVLTVPEAKMNGLTFAQVDRASAAVSMIQLSFVVNNYTYQ
jgi:hypothetical protein